jgi:hypothetical protein
MVLVGHSQRLAEPLSRRQRRTIATVGVFLVLCFAGAVAWLVIHPGSGIPPSRNGCVNVPLPGATGGTLFHACGQNARSWCAQQFVSTGTYAPTAQTQCRLAGIRPRS